ncbi:MAG: polysaccharide biosynthesis protein PslG [Chthoniobacter sp.]|jgi:hypothetical protein|nr:polysaccharide biosynthesis protein PslG [Chthoniobacter sp.]
MRRAFLSFAALCGSFVVASAAGPHPSLPPPVVPECFGVNIHFTDPQPGEMEMLAAAGFKWVRTDLTWAGTERNAGEYDFSAYDRLVAALDQFKLRAVFILDYGNKVYPNAEPPKTDEARAAFARWAVAAVSHFKGRGYLWEMWNEPNGRFWNSPAKTGDYIALARATGAALKQAGLLGEKGEACIGPATSTIDLPYLEACFKAGLLEYWDAVSVHPYRQSAPETVEEEYRSVRLLIRKYAPAGRTIPIISGEWGYSDAWAKFDREKQAKYLPRQFLTNVANDVALSIWYDWHDDGTNPKEIEHHFGIVVNEYHAGRDPVYDPKPAYTAMKTLTEQLSGFRFNKGSSGRLLFAMPERNVRLVSWCQYPSVLDGDRDGKLSVPGVIYYITPPSIEEQELWQTIAGWGRLPLEYVVRAPAKLVIPFSLTNPVSTTWRFGAHTDHYIPSDSPRLPRGLEKDKELLGFRGVSESVEFEVTEHARRQAIWQHLSLGQTSFVQWSKVVVTNALDLELLPPGPMGQPLRINNPSGEPFDSKAWLRSGGALEWKRLAFASGEKSTVIVFGSAKGSHLVFETGSPQTGGHFDAELARPGALPPLAARDFELRPEGDSRVDAEGHLTEGLPSDGAPPAQTAALKLDYRFWRGWKFLMLRRGNEPLNLHEGDGRGFGLWVHGDGKGCQARVRFKDSTGQVFQPDGPKIDWKGWRYVTFPMQTTEDKPLAHSGGANDGVIHYPIEWDSIFVLDNVSRQPVEGEIYLSAPALY